MNRYAILESLKEELYTTIQSNNEPYTSDIAEVQRGVYGLAEVSNRPFIGIALERDSVDQEMFDTIGTDQIRHLTVFIYCFMDSDGLGNFKKMNQMTTDIEYFLKYGFSHKKKTYVKDILPIEDSLIEPICYFGMYIDIQYENNL